MRSTLLSVCFSVAAVAVLVGDLAAEDIGPTVGEIHAAHEIGIFLEGYKLAGVKKHRCVPVPGHRARYRCDFALRIESVSPRRTARAGVEEHSVVVENRGILGWAVISRK